MTEKAGLKKVDISLSCSVGEGSCVILGQQRGDQQARTRAYKTRPIIRRKKKITKLSLAYF